MTRSKTLMAESFYNLDERGLMRGFVHCMLSFFFVNSNVDASLKRNVKPEFLKNCSIFAYTAV